MNRRVLVTGAGGFLGQNLVCRLKTRDDLEVLEVHRNTGADELARLVSGADVIFHLAGVNRPETEGEFEEGNVGFTSDLVGMLKGGDRRPLIVFSSSIKAAGDTGYGRSKRRAEEVLARFATEAGCQLAIFRLRNVFGKWSRPNYNSVVATFCHNIARGLPVTITDPTREIDLVYVDDVVDALVSALDSRGGAQGGYLQPDVMPSARIPLGALAQRVRDFSEIPRSLVIPDFSERFNVQLYATYLSYVEPRRWEYGLKSRADERGDLAEFIKSPWFGQVFVSRTVPGVTRGDHYHHTKTEKFLVVSGTGLIRLRHVNQEQVIEFPVRGADYRVVDIPPGFTHSITNTGADDMITLFWSSEVFDPNQPDTIRAPVDDAWSSS